MKKKILITGGSGFIGSYLVKELLKGDFKVVNFDLETYASNPFSLSEITKNKNYKHKKGDLGNIRLLKKVFEDFIPDRVIHLAAETHVDKSILSPYPFIGTNIIGTFNLLEVSRNYFSSLSVSRKKDFKLIHVSTDEVFGDLKKDDKPFDSNSKYNPSSPYSASKASSDHLVRAWTRTYSLPTIITNCTNNYGPFQHFEKLIPQTIFKALKKDKIPIYGLGNQIRDWIYVGDHVDALIKIMNYGKINSTYLIGAQNEIKNLEIVKMVCDILDKALMVKGFQHQSLIKFVNDRPGHDKRYAIKPNKLVNDLGWVPKFSLKKGLIKTVNWYISNQDKWMFINK